jgi:hypothetical protein
MKDINIEIDGLLNVLKENREKHVKEYEEAVIGFKQALIKELKKKLTKAKKLEEVILNFETIKPHSYKNSYDLMISKLEATSDTVVSLTDSEFQQYYLDQWSWKNSFETTTKMYK